MPFDETTGLFVSQDWKAIIHESQARYTATYNEAGTFRAPSYGASVRTRPATAAYQGESRIANNDSMAVANPRLADQFPPPTIRKAQPASTLDRANHQNEPVLYDAAAGFNRLASNPHSIVIEAFGFSEMEENSNLKMEQAGLGLFFGHGSPYNFHGNQNRMPDIHRDPFKMHALILAVECLSGPVETKRLGYPGRISLLRLERANGRQTSHLIVKTDFRPMVHVLQERQELDELANKGFVRGKKKFHTSSIVVPQGRSIQRLYADICYLEEKGVVVEFQAGEAEAFVPEAVTLAQYGAEEGRKIKNKNKKLIDGEWVSKIALRSLRRKAKLDGGNKENKMKVNKAKNVSNAEVDGDGSRAKAEMDTDEDKMDLDGKPMEVIELDSD